MQFIGETYTQDLIVTARNEPLITIFPPNTFLIQHQSEHIVDYSRLSSNPNEAIIASGGNAFA